MNFIKKNIIFTIVAVITLIGSIYLIVLNWMKHEEISKANELTQNSQKKFEEAYRKGNRPVDENINRIQRDTEELKKLTEDLQRIFGKPYRSALLNFAAGLNLTEDHLYERMKSLFDSAEGRNATAPKLIPKLFDRLALDLMAKEGKQSAEKEDAKPDPKYLNLVREQYRKFVADAQLETVEGIVTDASEDQMVSSGYYYLAEALGLPRQMNNSQARSYLKDLQAKFTVRRLIPGVTSETVVQNFTYNAYDKTPPPPDAVPDILSTMPIFEDIFRRMNASRLDKIDRFTRTGLPVKVAGGRYEAYSFEADVTGSLDSVRSFINNLLGAYKENRVYVITWVQLSSRSSTAEVEELRRNLFASESQTAAPEAEEPPAGRFPRGRRRGAPPPRVLERRRIMPQLSEFDAESQPDYGKTVIGASSTVNASLRFKYYKYIGDRLQK